MIRGTTQPFKITLPCSNTELEYITIYFSQPNNPSTTLPIIKTLTHCGVRNDDGELDGSNILYVTLDAWDTAQFSDRFKAKMQLRGKPFSSVEFSMPEHLITVYPMPDDLINHDPLIPPAEYDNLVVFDGDNIV